LDAPARLIVYHILNFTRIYQSNHCNAPRNRKIRLSDQLFRWRFPVKRPFALIAVLFSVSLLAGAPSALAASVQAGRDYTLIEPPQPVAGGGKIEVVEFFSYGCSHCNDFHPLITSWAAKLPKDVVFRRVPVSFSRPPWARLASIYYALEATGNVEKLDSLVFAATHKDRVIFDSNEAVANWATSKGADGKKIGDAMGSFGVQSRLKAGDQESVRYGITGVPALAVNGRYLINNSAAPNYGSLLTLVDTVVAKVRAENNPK
jgi:thiol:disulfide interchange protein DsbA